MLFRSGTAPKTWDGWVYHHEGVYYLYYLISDRFVCDGVGAATSRDGVHWTDHGWVLRHSDQMVRYLGFGSAWKDADFAQNGRFIGGYSEWRMEGDTNVQHLLFAWSDDLLRWQTFGDDFLFRIDERFYKKIEPDAQGPWQDPRWDGMCVVPRPGGGYYGYWTATPKDFLGFGFGQSADGLHWEALAPPRIEWGSTPPLYFVEVGGVHEIEGRYYAMLADYATIHCGMFGFVADAPEGPFRPCARNFDLLTNQSKMHAYFTRFIDSPDGVLVAHHSLAEGQFSDAHYVVYYAPLKKAVVIDESLYLAWWGGNDVLKQRAVQLGAPGAPIRFEPAVGIVLEGTLTLPGGLRIAGRGGPDTGILVDAQGVVELGPIQPDWAGFHGAERIDRERPWRDSVRFRLLLNHTMLEFYLDDLLIQCYSMDQPSGGSIATRGAADLHLWQWA